MAVCRRCGAKARNISGVIGFCVNCIRGHFQEVWPAIREVHTESRRRYGLPEYPPQALDGKSCPFCSRACRIPEGGRGYCGLRQVMGGRLLGGRPHEGNLSYYYDPLPTNCVGDFVCPGGTGCGYPRYAYSQGPEYGFKNLAVFYHACSFNCLYCQNAQFKERTLSGQRVSAREPADAVDDKTSCICFFGGDPTPQVLHAVKTSKLALDKSERGIMRVCWETNGAAREPNLSRMAALSLSSGGLVKVDLKAWNEGVHYALCGITNTQTLENFRRLADWNERRPEPPFLIASTLLVPGYVDEEEVSAIARFIAGLNPKIPYSLLAFYPAFYLRDLPTTSRSHALRCRDAAEDAGLHRVRIGNVHLLDEDY